MDDHGRDDHRRRAPSALEQRQQILLSSLPDTMVILYDRELRCVQLEGALVDALSFQRSDYVGKLLSELLSPTQFAALEPSVRRALAGETTSLHYPSPDGLRAYHIDLAPFVEAGAVTAAFTVWRDISAQLAREREMTFLAAIVEQSDDAIIAKDVDGIITEWNRGAELLYGYSAAEAVGAPIAMIVPPERAGEDEALLSRVLAGEAVRQFETARIRRDGRRIDVSVSISPVRDRVGAVIGASVIARDITDRKQLEDRLRHLADHDALTGLFNRRRFESELDRAVADAARYGTSYALAMIDLDGFKDVNDTLGHAAGDALIDRVGGLLLARLRETDVVARIGGDEFAVILSHSDARSAGRVCAALLTELAERAFTLAEHGQARVTASIGVTVFDGANQMTADELLIEADLAMYRVKQSGRNGWRAHPGVTQRQSV